MASKKVRFLPDEEGYKAVRFQVRLSQKDYEKLESIAQKKGMTKSEVIRNWITKSK